MGANDNLRPHISPSVLFIGRALFVFMDIVYGKKPSLGKFRVLEVVARIPYQSWEAVHYFFNHSSLRERTAGDRSISRFKIRALGAG